MDKQKFINYINNELGLEIDETSPAYPYLDELYEALLPYKEELDKGIYRLLSTDNFEDYYHVNIGIEATEKVADIDVPHWFDITVYRSPKYYKYYIEFTDRKIDNPYFMQTVLFDTEEQANEWFAQISFIDAMAFSYAAYMMRVPVNEDGDIDGDVEKVGKIY